MGKAKDKVKFVCSECGYDTIKWMGKCPSCGSWNTLTEFRESKNSISKNMAAGLGLSYDNKPVKMADIKATSNDKLLSGIGEFDRVIGGGIVEGMIALIGGDPGIGKSTIMLQLAGKVAAKGKKVLYVSGEESLNQIKLRAVRLQCDNENFLVYAETDVLKVKDCIIKEKPELVIIDSIQTVYSPEIDSAPGSVSQLRESASMLGVLAKKENIPVFLIGHVTKDGNIAGPKLIEHMVDTVLYFEGDRYYHYRILRTVKNRFGSTNEIGIFEMKNEGLLEVPNPSEFFLNPNMTGEESSGISGSSVTASIEGSRPFLIEVQALVSQSNYGNPQRNCVGYDPKRLSKILAVLEKRVGLHFGMQDVFLNITGGSKLNDPAADLSIAASLFSSFSNIELSGRSVFIGEIGLGGEIRTISGIESRISEAQKLGFSNIFIPKSSKVSRSKFKIKIIRISSVEQLFDYLR